MISWDISQQGEKYPLLLRFTIYGLLGWGMEITWTGFGSLLENDATLVGHTYLWMFPIYGMAVLLERVHFFLDGLKWWERGVAWVAVIWMLEAFSGYVIRTLTGSCPWDYSTSPDALLGGLIRTDYAPAWFMVGLMFEQLHYRLKNPVADI